MKHTLLFPVALLAFFNSQAQIGIGTKTPNPHAVLDLKSPGNNQGLLAPDIRTAQRTSTTFTSGLSSSDNGLLVFDSDEKTFYYWNGNQWEPMLHGSVTATPVGPAGGDLAGSYPSPVIGNGKVTSAALLDGAITDVDISTGAAIVDSKLAIITTPGKVSGNAITSGMITGPVSVNVTGPITTTAVISAAGGIVTTASMNGTMISATNTAQGGGAISGVILSTSGGSGVYGQGNGTVINKVSYSSLGVSGKNVYFNTNGYLGGQYGVYGQSATGPAIYGAGPTGIHGHGGTTGNGIGVSGFASGTGSYGVYSNGFAGGTTTWNASSDRRFKKNIGPLTDGLSKILSLRGVRFDWRLEEFPAKNFFAGHDIGLIAQEVKEVLPEVVIADKDGYYSVSYEKIVPVLIEAVRQQQIQIESLEKKMAELTRTARQ